MRRRPLTPVEAGLILALAVLTVLCCLGCGLIGLAAPDPAPLAPAPSAATP